MHNVLDPRDWVPDEAEQRQHSGYEAAGLRRDAIAAAELGDLTLLERIAEQLAALPRQTSWAYQEPDDPDVLRATAACAGRLVVDEDTIGSRVRGAWLGRAVANTMGKPVEGLTRQEVEIYLRAVSQWPQRDYLPFLEPLPAGVSHLHESAPFASAGRFSDVPRDDDLDWTVLGLSMLERHGLAITTDQIAAEWLDGLPFTQTFTAERAAYRNLIHGLTPPHTATRNNPYREWIGALIRADIFGLTLPGNPARAAELAIVDARLSHVANGVYGEMWAAALVSAALCVTDTTAAFDAALPVVPEGSRLHAALLGVRSLYDGGCSATAALDWVDQELGHYNWVHTINNAALISIGMLWGRDFTDAVAITISGGRDTDSSAATVGCVYGAVHGVDAIPSHLVGTTHVRLSSSVPGFDKITIEELASRTLALAERFRDTPPVRA